MAKKKSRVPTLADKHDAALASLRQARAKIKKLEGRPTYDASHLREKIAVAAMLVLESHGIMGETAKMLAENIAAKIDEGVEIVVEEVSA
jgi:hypothetical protein